MDSISVTTNETSKSINVEKIENGYLIIRTKEGKDDKGEYYYETKKYFSENNPLEDVEIPLAERFNE